MHRLFWPQPVCYSDLCALQPMRVLLIWLPMKLLVHEHVSPIDVIRQSPEPSDEQAPLYSLKRATRCDCTFPSARP